MRRCSIQWNVAFLVAAMSLVFARAGVVRGMEGVLNQPPEGFVALFNGRDLAGWKGLVGDPVKRAKMSEAELTAAQTKADEQMREHWMAADGVLCFDGKGDSLCTARDYADFEMLVDWKIEKGGDSGIYLRGSPQVQIWDTARLLVGAQVGSGGLYNNKKNPDKPLKVADRPVGQWNTFRIIMIGQRVTVYLNDELVVNDVVMENYWDRSEPIYPTGQIELQSHSTPLYFRNIYIREILTARERLEGFTPLFNGWDMAGWTGNTTGYYAKDGRMICDPAKAGGNVYTDGEYGNFALRFEFKLSPGANNGLGIRTPRDVDAAYEGMEIQILDDTAPQYATLQPYQYHGSIYGVVPAERGHLKPVGQWNAEEVTADGPRVTVKLNDATIVDADIEKASLPQTMDKHDHPGLRREKGYICFCGHGDYLEFRNIRIKPLDE